jgi:hypothetical protein
MRTGRAAARMVKSKTTMGVEEVANLMVGTYSSGKERREWDGVKVYISHP